MLFMNGVSPVFHELTYVPYLYKRVNSKRIQLGLSGTKWLNTVNVRYIIHCIPRAGAASEPGPGCCSSYR